MIRAGGERPKCEIPVKDVWGMGIGLVGLPVKGMFTISKNG